VTRIVLLASLVFVFSAGAAAARGGDHGGGGGSNDDARVAGNCGGGTSSLRIHAHENTIEVRFRVRETRRPALWRLTIVHENRVASRATAATTRSEDSFELRRTFRDLPGSDTVTVYAWGPEGVGCRATATLPADA
jgi:hypothetical protein